MPPELKERITESAKASGRSMHAEIVHRLSQSFNQIEPTGTSEEIQALSAERDQQREFAEQFRSITDATDSLRTLLAQFHLATLEKLHSHGLDNDRDQNIERICAQWLTESDPRGAAFSILRLIDGSNPEVVDALRKFAAQLEDLGMVRKRITLVKGKSDQKQTQKRDSRSVNKVILVGNLGRDPEINYLPAGIPPPNKGPVKRTRNKPPK